MANGEVWAEIRQVLNEETSLTIKQRDRIIIAAMQDMNSKINELVCLSERVTALERKSIIMWVEKHPKLTLGVLGFFIVVMAIPETRAALLAALGLLP